MVNSQPNPEHFALPSAGRVSQVKLNTCPNVRLIKKLSNIYSVIPVFATSPYLARLLETYHD